MRLRWYPRVFLVREKSTFARERTGRMGGIVQVAQLQGAKIIHFA